MTRRGAALAVKFDIGPKHILELSEEVAVNPVLERTANAAVNQEVAATRKVGQIG